MMEVVTALGKAEAINSACATIVSGCNNRIIVHAIIDPIIKRTKTLRYTRSKTFVEL